MPLLRSRPDPRIGCHLVRQDSCEVSLRRHYNNGKTITVVIFGLLDAIGAARSVRLCGIAVRAAGRNTIVSSDRHWSGSVWRHHVAKAAPNEGSWKGPCVVGKNDHEARPF